MRLQRATLLISSVGVLSALNVLSAPVRIVVVKEVVPDAAGAFLRSARIGLAGAKANLHGAAAAGVLDPDFSFIPPPSTNQESESKSDYHLEVPALDADADPNSNSNPNAGLEFPHLPSFIEAAIDEARNAAIHAAEKEHDRLLDLEKAHEAKLKNNEAAKKMFEEVKAVSCTNPKSWRAKVNKVENWFRKLVGLTIIKRSQCSEQVQSYHIVTESNSVPVAGPAVKFSPVDAAVPCHKKVASPATVITLTSTPGTRPRSRHGRLWGWRRPQTFWGRLQKALYSLSPWEGRALAFVLGCGIGVLLRMVYVFIVLGVRLWKCKRAQSIQLAEQDAQVTIFDVNELEEEELPPPMYDEHEKRSID